MTELPSKTLNVLFDDRTDAVDTIMRITKTMCRIASADDTFSNVEVPEWLGIDLLKQKDAYRKVIVTYQKWVEGMRRRVSEELYILHNKPGALVFISLTDKPPVENTTPDE